MWPNLFKSVNNQAVEKDVTVSVDVPACVDGRLIEVEFAVVRIIYHYYLV